MAARARSHLERVPACPHGSFSHREALERGMSRGEVIDFSASCNPLGTSPAVLASLAGVELARYPDDDATQLRQSLGSSLGIDPGWIVVGNGSVELMWLLAMAYLEPGDRALVVGPTFGEYQRACRVMGASVEQLLVVEGDGFRPDVGAIACFLRRERPKLAFLCNPNNPTGQLLGSSQLLDLLDGCEETLLVVDEAYATFCDSPPNLLPHLASGRLVLLRSMTKDHGLAGLRLGYAAAHPEVIGWLNRVRPPWSVNAMAQAAGLAALGAVHHLEEGRRVVAESRALLSRELPAMGLRVVPSAANFLLVRVGNAAGFRAALLARGICVRDCTSFGLPAHIRIGLRTLPECRRLLDATREVVQGA